MLGNDDERRPDYTIIISVGAIHDRTISDVLPSVVEDNLEAVLNVDVVQKFVEDRLDTLLSEDVRDRVWAEVY